jgi:group I intron endonuclease
MIIYFVSMNNEIMYIGQTKLSLDKRRKQHEYNASRGKGYIIGSSIRKHGSDKFTWTVHSIYYNQADLDAAEKHYIQKYRPKYNINSGGESRGIRKNKGSIPWNKGKKRAQVAWNKGRKESRPEVLNNIKISAQNRVSTLKISSEHRAALVNGRRRKYAETNKQFVCNENQKTYILVVDAAKDLGIPAYGIYAVLNPKHRMKSFRNFTFKYI